MKPNDNAVIAPNLGLYYNTSSWLVPRRGLVDGLNFRIKNKKLNNYNLGRTLFFSQACRGRVMKIYTHTDRTAGDTLFFADPTDIYKYSATGAPMTFMTPRYDTGTVAVAATAVTGTGTLWAANAKTNDQIMFGAAAYNGMNPSGNDAFTKILLHMNGADASTVFTDFNAGASAHVWTARGNAQVDTADFALGGASLLLDGTGDWIDTPDAAAYAIGTADFAINLRFKATVGGDGLLIMLAGQNDAAFTLAGTSWWLSREANNQVAFHLSNGTVFLTQSSGTTYSSVSNPGWHDVEIDRSAGVVTMYIDGVQKAQNTFAGNVPDSASIMSVGAAGALATNTWFGWIDEFRFSIGAARHAAAFTIATEEFYTPWFNIANVGGNLAITLSTSPGTIAALSPYTIRKLYVTTTADQWQFATFLNDGTSGKDIMFATNGQDFVQTWSVGDTQMTSQSTLGFTCKALGVFANMMIYGNLVEAGQLRPTSIINSDVSKPLAAGALGTGLSEELIVYNDVQGIDSIAHIGNSMVIYSPVRTVAGQFVGSPEIFAFREASRDIGPIGPCAFADFGDYHEFLGPDGGYRYDGVAIHNVAEHVMREMRSALDPVRKRFVYTTFLDQDGEVIWSIPAATDAGAGNLGTAPVNALVEHYLEAMEPTEPQPWSKRSFVFTATGTWSNKSVITWDMLTLTWDQYLNTWADFAGGAGSVVQLGGDVNGNIWVFNNTQKDNGVDPTSYVQFPRFATGNRHEKDLLQRCYPYTTPSSGTLSVTTLISNFRSGTLAGAGTLSFDQTMTTDVDFVSPMTKSRYAAFQMGSNTNAWQIEGYDFDIADKPGGTR